MPTIDLTGARESLTGSLLGLGAREGGGAKKARQARRPSIGAFTRAFGGEADPAGGLGPLRDLAPSEEAVQELLDGVRSAGDDLKDRPFPEEILRYKRAVRDFVRYVVENGLAREDLVGVPNAQKAGYRGRLSDPEAKLATRYHTVRVVDRELEALAAKILAGQTTQMQRVAMLDRMTGLLVDITLTGKIQKDENG